jgi:broad specificity phosphatase PhoE
MRPKRIFFVRHGQSQGNVDQRTHETVPDYKIQLTELGKEQARKAGHELSGKIGLNRVACYVSPYVRTKQTFGEIQKSFIPTQIERVREDPRLREQEWGHLRAAEVTDAIDAERQQYGTFFYRIPDGESGADVYDRATGFLATLYRDFEQDWFPDNVIIVTHGFTLRVLLMRWLHWTVDEFHELANPPNCSIFELARNDNFIGRRRYELTTPFPKKGEIPIHR